VRKLILVAVIGLGAWSYYQHELSGRSPAESDRPHQVTKPGHVERSTAGQIAPKFKCDGRQYCSQMKSRAEAEFLSGTARTQRWTETAMEFHVKTIHVSEVRNIDAGHAPGRKLPAVGLGR